MDLIYRNDVGEDIGVLNDFIFDLAYGSDENDFELQLPLNSHCCKKGYTLYIENTEYGGIIDRIKVETKNKLVKYSGRTWHGIMAKKIICPEEGQDYRYMFGMVEEVLKELINDAGLNDVFNVIKCDSIIIHYRFDRYIDLYSGIKYMLKDYGAKLLMTYNGGTGKVDIAAIYLYDYSKDEEWDSDLLDFQIESDYAPPNHFVCLGSGELRRRNVIHLFTDQNGGIQNYYSDSCPRLADGTPIPTNDSHYNLTTDKQVLFNVQEVTEKYDYPNAGAIENYVPLAVKPSRWESRYYEYYYMDEGGEYAHVETESVHEMQPLEEKPANWDSNYSMYVTANGEKVTGITTQGFTKYPKTTKPPGWESIYNMFYFADGIGGYKKVSADSVPIYTRQTVQPTDWTTNWKNYYELVDEYQKLPTPRPEYMKGRYYVKEGNRYRRLDNGKPADWDAPWDVPYYKTVKVYKAVGGSKAPTWKSGNYYTKGSKSIPPEWHYDWQYYVPYVSVTPPPWEKGKYFLRLDYSSAPAFIPNMYYELQLDHYAELVAAAVEYIQEAWECNSVNINLDASKYSYDLGDIVGATEIVTGMFVAQVISKKIVTIKNNQISIKYEIGG